ncbi:MAG: ABC transporter ATP-binding protein [Candidatus Rokubacteria bacterium]|nr:ABC transporter ATP-binding protein [Candidatus Rokubacteria bacterium]
MNVACKIQAVGVRKEYEVSRKGGDRILALDGVDLEVHAGEFLAILGPSGCGKSTFLNIAAGLERSSAGEIRIDGQHVEGPGPDRAMCFQDHVLFPWKTVWENVEFGLRVRGLGRKERAAIVAHYLGLVGLSKFANQYPHELSGGMRQRCALARTFALDAATLLMDEPFASVDAQTRNILQEEILRIWDQGAGPRKTVVYVTHSIEEAVFLADRVAVMTARPGRVLGVFDVPLYRPRNDETRSDSFFRDLVVHLWKVIRDQVERIS